METDDKVIQQILQEPRLMQDYLDRLSTLDLYTFTNHILGYENARHHREWYDILQNRLMMNPAEDTTWDSPLVPAVQGHENNRIMLMAPRNHAKSTAFTVNYTLWEIGRNHNVRILIVSATGGQSSAFLREIKNHMMLNLNYRRVYGDIFPEEALNGNSTAKLGSTWTTSEIIVKRDNPRMKDPTVAVTSALGTVLSRRADIIICDDILSEANTKTALQREKTREWFNDVLMPVLEPDGRIIVVGTAWNLEDFYHELMKKPSYNIRKRYQAITNEKTKDTLWKERWSYDKLMELKDELGSTSFNKSYMNMAMSQEDAIFKQEWTEAAKLRGKLRTLLTHFDYATWDLGKVVISMGVDLAISTKDGSDFTAMAVLAELENGDKIPLHLEESKYSPSETRKRIVELAELFNPSVIVVENNAYQEALRIDLAETTSLPIVGYTTGGEKFDAEIGLNSLAVEFENGKWILPYDTSSGRTRGIVDKLVDGMLRFPSGHTQDILMALWFANTGLRKLKKGKNTARMTVKKTNIFRR